MDDRDRRIEDLEIQLAFQENLVGKLDGVVRDLGDRLDALGTEVERLRGELTRLAETTPGESTDLSEEKPPHY